MDVFEAMKIMRSRVPGLRIVLFTLADSPDDRCLAEMAGVDGYVVKNQGTAVLLNTIRKVAGRFVRLCPEPGPRPGTNGRHLRRKP